MITTHLHWSSDISAAPKGEMVTTPYTIMVKGEPKERTRTEHVPVKILALTKCGKVVSTYWLLGTAYGAGRWSGLADGESPLLWALWPDAAELAGSVAAIDAVEVLEGCEVDA